MSVAVQASGRTSGGCAADGLGSFSRNVQDGVPGRNAPSQRQSTGANSARDVKIFASLGDEAVTPAKGRLACVGDDADPGNSNLAAVRMSCQCQMRSRWYVGKPGRIVSKDDGWSRPLHSRQYRASFRASDPRVRHADDINRISCKMYGHATIAQHRYFMAFERTCDSACAIFVIMIAQNRESTKRRIEARERRGYRARRNASTAE